MIYSHSMDRAARYYPERPALYVGGGRQTFRELHDRVMSLAAALTGRGFNAGDRLALLLPNSPEYLEFVYACSRLGVIVVPINRITRLPRHLEFSKTDLPKNGSGRVLKRILRERFWVGATRSVG